MNRNTSLISRLVICLVGMILLLLMSCDYTLLGKRIGDGGLLSGEPCPAPCFWEIRPGITTKDQAIEILRSKAAISDYQMNNLVFYGDAVSFEFDSNGLVDRITFTPSTSITVGSLIAKYGSPDAVIVIYNYSSTPEHNSFAAGIFYDSLSTYVGLIGMQDTWPPVYHVGQDTLITYVSYFADSSYMTWKESSTHHISRWNGYGDYKDTP